MDFTVVESETQSQKSSARSFGPVSFCLAWSPKSLKSGPLLELFMFRAFCFVSNFLL